MAYRGSSSEEFEGVGSEEFEGSSSEEFEESKALNDWLRKIRKIHDDLDELRIDFRYDDYDVDEYEKIRKKRIDWNNNRKFDIKKKRIDWNNNRKFDIKKKIEKNEIVIENTSAYEKSGDAIMDNFILENKLKWFPYDEFENVEYLDKGGFGTIYKAIYKYNKVVLKCHNNLLSENLNEFLNEWEYHKSCLSSHDIIYFYGFTKDPDTLKYMVVMDYANKGNLRGNLTRIIKRGWNKKLYMLFGIISGLNDIHKQNLIHCDIHDGNILNHNESKVYISDLGLCKPLKSFLKKYDIYGVIPFMAPEVLRGNSYTPASDIYSFSMIMWEFISGVPPFNNRAHDLQLSLSICEGERPEIIENTPQCYVDLMKKCWDENPLKRPSSKEVLNIIKKWISLSDNVKIEDINEELKCNIMEFINAPIGHNNLATESHSQACYTSRLLNFTSKQLNEILESKNSQTTVQVSEMLVSEDLNECMLKLDIKTNEN